MDHDGSIFTGRSSNDIAMQRRSQNFRRLKWIVASSRPFAQTLRSIIFPQAAQGFGCTFARGMGIYGIAVQPSGKLCRRSHSVGVSLRTAPACAASAPFVPACPIEFSVLDVSACAHVSSSPLNLAPLRFTNGTGRAGSAVGSGRFVVNSGSGSGSSIANSAIGSNGIDACVNVGGSGSALGGHDGRGDAWDEPVAFGVWEVRSGVPEPCGEGLGEVPGSDALSDASWVADEVLALVAGGSSAALAPLPGDGRSDDVEVVLLPSSRGGDSCSGTAARERSSDAVAFRATSRCVGSARPRFPARLKIPAHACGLKKNLG